MTEGTLKSAALFAMILILIGVISSPLDQGEAEASHDIALQAEFTIAVVSPNSFCLADDNLNTFQFDEKARPSVVREVVAFGYDRIVSGVPLTTCSGRFSSEREAVERLRILAKSYPNYISGLGFNMDVVRSAYVKAFRVDLSIGIEELERREGGDALHGLAGLIDEARVRWGLSPDQLGVPEGLRSRLRIE